MPSGESDALRAHYQSISDRLAANPNTDLTAIRSMLEELHVRSAEPAGVSYEEVAAGNRPGLLCTPTSSIADRAILYLHGGGFVANSMHSHRKLAAHVAKSASCTALVLDYRLAPEDPFPASIDDTAAAYQWLQDRGFATDHIAIAGDSAGGNLATAFVLSLRDEAKSLPAAVVAFSPWYDLECQGVTFDTNAATDAFVQRSVAQGMASMYLGGASPRDPRANPLVADLRGLPPTFLAAGTHETLQDDSERFADIAKYAGVDVTLEICPGMQHIYPLMVGRAPEADAAVSNAANWLRPKLGIA